MKKGKKERKSDFIIFLQMRNITKKNEKKLAFFENKVLKTIFSARKYEISEEFRKLHNFEMTELYNFLNIVRVVKRDNYNRQNT